MLLYSNQRILQSHLLRGHELYPQWGFSGGFSIFTFLTGCSSTPVCEGVAFQSLTESHLQFCYRLVALKYGPGSEYLCNFETIIFVLLLFSTLFLE